MSLLRFVPRFLALLLHLLGGLLLVGIVYPFIGPAARGRLNRRWSRGVLRICGVRLTVEGEPVAAGPILQVANHVSWLDIFVLNAVRPSAFVAKREIRNWPLVGWLVAGAGTVFIERGQRHAMQAVAQIMQTRFARGEALTLFPEGTTSGGMSLLPFHTGLFESARLTGVTIQPVALRYLRDGRRDPYAAFIGDETLVANLWRVLSVSGLAVEVAYAPPLPARDAAGELLSRAALSRNAREAIAARLGQGVGEDFPEAAAAATPR